MNQALLDFISRCPTAYHTAAQVAARLEAAGFAPLQEGEKWDLTPGKGYYVTRNGSSLIAFRAPEGEGGFMIAAAHGDSPSFKVKENPELPGDNGLRLSVEKYGGMLCAPWLDRPLSLAGRAVVRTGTGVESRLIDFYQPVALIPTVAIHMNRKANEGMSYDAAVDMLPLYGGQPGTLRARAAALAGVEEPDLLAWDLYLYPTAPGTVWGEYVSAPRLDDLQCVFAALTAFLQAKPRAVPVLAVFDNEEVGSRTKQGAASTLLSDVLRRICGGEEEYRRRLADSLMLSCDNAHAVHPNHPEYADKNHTVRMNGGVVIKYNANQHYTSDGVSAALFRLICREAGVPVQLYANRADMPGGSTLGNIADATVSVNTVDIGLAQLAMHSCYETAGAADTAYMAAALTAFFGKRLQAERDGRYTLL